MARVLFRVLALVVLGGATYGAEPPPTTYQDEEGEDFLVSVVNISPSPEITLSESRALLHSSLDLHVKKGDDTMPQPPTEEEHSWLVKSGSQSVAAGEMISSGSIVTVIIIPPPDWTVHIALAVFVVVVVVAYVVMRRRGPARMTES